MKDQIALLDQDEEIPYNESWKLDDRTRRIGLKQVAIARQLLLANPTSAPSRRTQSGLRPISRHH